MKTKNYVMGVLEYLFMFLLAIDCNSVYRHVEGKSIVPQIWNWLIILAVLIIALQNGHAYKKIGDKVLGVVLYNTFFMAIVQMPQSEIMIYTRLFLLFYPLTIILCYQKIQDGKPFILLFKFETVVLFLAVSSVVLWFLGVVFGVLEPNMSRPVTWNSGEKYNGFYGLLFMFHTQREKLPFLNISVLRNIGIYTEAPMYDLVLVCALYVELFLKEKSSIIKSFILCLTIITSFGTFGIMLMIFGVGLKAMICIKSHVKFKLVFSIICIAVAGIFIALIINKSVNAKGSFSAHLDDYYAGIKAWSTSPVIGTGFSNFEIIHSFMNPKRGNSLGMSNSITTVLAQGGLIGVAIYLAPFFSLFKQYKKVSKLVCWALAPLFMFFLVMYEVSFWLFFVLAICWANSWFLQTQADTEEKNSA